MLTEPGSYIEVFPPNGATSKMYQNVVSVDAVPGNGAVIITFSDRPGKLVLSANMGWIYTQPDSDPEPDVPAPSLRATGNSIN